MKGGISMGRLSHVIGEVAPQTKPDAAQIAAHARSLLAKESVDPKIALDAITALLAELRSKFSYDDNELVPIIELISHLTELSTAPTRENIRPSRADQTYRTRRRWTPN